MEDITQPIGGPVGLAPNPLRLAGPPTSSHVAVPLETNPDLRFPESITEFSRMATNGKVGSILRAIVLQIRKAPWSYGKDGVRPEVLDFVKRNIALGSDASRARPRHQGIIFDEHLRESLSMVHLGFSAFEPLYTIVRARTDEELRLNMPYIAYLRKLDARDATSIREINVDEDGGLAGITQRVQLKDGSEEDRFIPVERLLLYTNERRGADWYGRSILREAYMDYYLKDQLVRINAMGLERNSMGVPVVYYDPTVMNETDALRIATQFKAGSSSGVAFPTTSPSAKVELVAVSGTIRDPLPTIEMHDHAISRSVLAMFLDLGHDGGLGSAGIGNTFVDVFTASIEAIANELATTFTEHVIRDLVELNFGPNEPYPVLTPGALSASRNIDPAVLKNLVDAGVITPSDLDEEYIRAKYGLPEMDPELSRANKPEPPAPIIMSTTGDNPVDKAISKGEAIVEEGDETALSAADQHYAAAAALFEAVNESRAKRHV